LLGALYLYEETLRMRFLKLPHEAGGILAWPSRIPAIRHLYRSGIDRGRFSLFSNPAQYDKTNHLRLQGFFYRDF
jgi:hypothetical protein